MKAAVGHLPQHIEYGRSTVPDILVTGREAKLKPLLDCLTKRKLSFRQFAYLSKALAVEHGQPELAFNHVSVSNWFNGRRTPKAAHRQVIAALLQLPLTLVDGAFDPRTPLPKSSSLSPRTATLFVLGTTRSFEYPVTVRPGLDLNAPAVYEDGQWEKMFSVYPANLKRHLNGSKPKLCGWVPDNSFRPLIPHANCLVLLKRPTTIPALSDPVGFEKKIWFIGLPSGKVDLRFMYRDGAHFVTWRPGRDEERFKRDATDPLGYATGKMLFRLDLRSKSANRH